MNKFNQLFTQKFPVLGMLHLKGETSDDVFSIAQKEISDYYEAGIDAVIVEDYFGTKADVERVLVYLNAFYSDRIYGVNVLNDFKTSYELAHRYRAKFIQVDSVAGHLPPHEDAEYDTFIQDIRTKYEDSIVILGGVRFKHQAYLSNRSLEDDLVIGCRRCHAIVVTGDGTGLQTPDQKIQDFRTIIGDFPLIVGAGVTLETLKDKIDVTDGAIVGSYFKDTYKDDGNLAITHIQAFLKRVHTHREHDKGV